MPLDTFAVIAEPTRRRILEELRMSERSVRELVDALAVSAPTMPKVSQPTMSKHLKVLRSSGFVSSRTAAQQRIYRIETGPFEAVEAWLEPYRRMWAHHFDVLERHLDSLSTDGT
jgi:DNA-binding transcriptional ArsR family regulator